MHAAHLRDLKPGDLFAISRLRITTRDLEEPPPPPHRNPAVRALRCARAGGGSGWWRGARLVPGGGRTSSQPACPEQQRRGCCRGRRRSHRRHPNCPRPSRPSHPGGGARGPCRGRACSWRRGWCSQSGQSNSVVKRSAAAATSTVPASSALPALARRCGAADLHPPTPRLPLACPLQQHQAAAGA